MKPTIEYIEQINTTTRLLRKNQTPSEKVLWEEPRDHRFIGRKFLRQHAIRFEYYGKLRFFVADFYCAAEKLIIELDGPIHELQQDYDEMRTWIINQLGFRVIRFTNDELANIAEVLERIGKEFG